MCGIPTKQCLMKTWVPAASNHSLGTESKHINLYDIYTDSCMKTDMQTSIYTCVYVCMYLSMHAQTCIHTKLHEYVCVYPCMSV